MIPAAEKATPKLNGCWLYYCTTGLLGQIGVTKENPHVFRSGDEQLFTVVFTLSDALHQGHGKAPCPAAGRCNEAVSESLVVTSSAYSNQEKNKKSLLQTSYLNQKNSHSTKPSFESADFLLLKPKLSCHELSKITSLAQLLN